MTIDPAFLALLQLADGLFPAGGFEDGLTPGQHAVAFGCALGRAGADGERTAAAYLYSTAALLVGAGLRLIALGQVEGQRVLAALRPRVARLGSEAGVRTVEEMWSFNPGLELAGIRHATVDTPPVRCGRPGAPPDRSSSGSGG